MKSITEFNSDTEYYEYLTVYFAGLAMQTRIARGEQASRRDISVGRVNDAEALVDQLKIKFKK